VHRDWQAVLTALAEDLVRRSSPFCARCFGGTTQLFEEQSCREFPSAIAATRRAGVEAKLGFKAHPHMLRHACFALANAGHDTRALQAYLGHKNIQHTVRYTDLAPTRFKDFWRD
jgi:site-specific recombinase XerD